MEVPWSDRQPPSIRLLYAAIAGAVATALAFLIEAPLARFIAQYQPSKAWNSVLDVLEWGVLLPLDPHALPVALVVGVLAVVFVKRWRAYAPALMTLAFVHLSTRYLTNVLKDATGRLRPYELLSRGVDDSFGYPGGISFPSGHVTLFASVAIPILWVFPRTRRFAIPLLAIVAFVAVARIAVNAHWISDTLGSLTLVTFVTWAVSWATRPTVSPS